MGQEPLQPVVRKPVPPRGANRTSWVRDWAVLGIGIATVVALLALAVVAMIFAMSERRQLTELSTHTQDRLNDIDRELAALGAGLGELVASAEVSRPDFASRVPDLLSDTLKRAVQREDPIFAIETAIAITRKAQQLKIEVSPQQLGEIAQGFLTLVDDESPILSKEKPSIPADWTLSGPSIDAVSSILGYRSSLLPPPAGMPEEGSMAHGAMLRLPKLHTFRPLDSTSKIFGSSRAVGKELVAAPAKMNLLTLSDPMLTEECRSVVVEGYDVVLDGLDIRNAVFSHCNVSYSGEAVTLDNVYFSHCTFKIGRRGKDFATAVLAAGGPVGLVKR